MKRIILIVLFFALFIQSLQYLNAASTLVPDFYGVYMVSNGKIVTLKDAVTEKRIKTFGDFAHNYRGINQLSGIIALPDSYFLIYDKNANGIISQIQLSRLEYATKMQVEDIMAQKTWVDANMWIFKESVSFNIGPVKGEQDLYRLVPKTPLVDGIYALDAGKLSHAFEQASSYAYEAIADFVVGKIPETTKPVVDTKTAFRQEMNELASEINDRLKELHQSLLDWAGLSLQLGRLVENSTAEASKCVTAIQSARKVIKNTENVLELAAANGQIESNLNHIFMLVEVAGIQLGELDDKFAKSTNILAIMRRSYNDAVNEYNTKLKAFPASREMGMEAKELFKIVTGNKESPKVNFD